MDADGTSWLLLGRPTPTGSQECREDLARTPGARVLDVVAGWNGRFCLLSATELFTDAFGAMPVYYDGHVLGTSLSLLHPGAARLAGVSYDQPMNWVPPPATPVPGISRLLASQVLRLGDRQVRPRPLISPAPTHYDAVLSVMQERLTRAVLGARGPSMRLPLTAGYDSRLLLAVCASSGVDVRCYTQVHSRISSADLTMPPQLARACGFPHDLVRRRRRRPDRRALSRYDEQVGGLVSDADRRFMGFGQFDFLQPEDVLIRGVGFEVGRFYFRSLPEELSLPALISRFRPEGPAQQAGLAAWVEWCLHHPEPLDWRDRFYWEQRIGGWVGPNEAGLDLLPGRRVNPALTQHVASAVLQIPLDVRRRSQHHLDLVERMAPRLAAWPINPPGSPWSPRTLRRRAAKVGDRLRRQIRNA